MNDNERLQLQKLITANNVEDQTGLIRKLKHSELLRNDINHLVFLMNKYGNESIELVNEAMTQCNFLFTYYTDIYNKIRKNEIDLKLLVKFLDILKQIENGELDQHEGSFVVGKILKEIYIDSALKKADKIKEVLDKNTKKVPIVQPLNITWKEFTSIKKETS